MNNRFLNTNSKHIYSTYSISVFENLCAIIAVLLDSKKFDSPKAYLLIHI